MKNILKNTNKIIVFSITAIFSALIVWLLFVTSCNMASFDIGTHTAYFREGFFIKLLITVCVILIFSIINSKIEQGEGTTKSVRYTMYVLQFVLFIISLIWIFKVNIEPVYDQREIVNAALELREGNLSTFSEEGYVARCTNQLGIVEILYFMSFITGDDVGMALRVINCFGLIIVYACLSILSEKLTGKYTSKIAVYCIGILFYPLILYCSFIYGNIMGLALSLVSFLQLLSYLEDGKKIGIVISAIAIMFAILFKSNYLIFMVAEICIILYHILKSFELNHNKTVKEICIPFVTDVLTIAMIVLATVASLKVPEMFISKKVGWYEDIGIESSTYIAMGLAEGGAFTSEGWYNGLNDQIYNESSSKEEQNRKAKEYITDSLTRLKSSKSEAIKYFTRKQASQWVDGTFQAYRTAGLDRAESGDYGIFNFMFDERNRTRLSMLENWLEFVVIAGCFLFCISRARNNNSEYAWIYLVVTFIGGFLFHTIWEASSQYTLSYYVLLFPLAVQGYDETGREILKIKDEKTINKYTKSLLLNPAILVFAICAVACVTSIGRYALLLNGLSRRLDKTSLKNECLVEQGQYKIKSTAGLGYIAEVTGSSEEHRTIGVSADGDMIVFEPFQDTYTFKLGPSQFYVFAKKPDNTSEEIQVTADSGLSGTQKWRICNDKSGRGQIIYAGNLGALTYDEQMGFTIRPFIGVDNQIWKLEQVN